VDKLTNGGQRGYASRSGVGHVSGGVIYSTGRPQLASQARRRVRAGQTATHGIVHTRYDDDEESLNFSL
jgi:hypothetical protein